VNGANNPVQFGVVPSHADATRVTLSSCSEINLNWQVPRITFKETGEFLAPGMKERFPILHSEKYS
jgi:hypothetical protein